MAVMETKPPTTPCLNCDTPLEENNKFCPQCGQSKKSFTLHLKDVVTNVLYTLFNLDNTLYRTLALLFTPWELTKNYIAGRRVAYYHPTRIFLILLFLLFSVLTIFYKPFSDIQPGYFGYATKEDFELLDKLDTISDELKLDDNTRNKFIRKTFGNRTVPNDSMNFKPVLVLENFSLKKVIPLREAATLPMDSLHQKYGIKGFWEKLYFTQMIKQYRNSNDFITYVIGNILWTIPIGVFILAACMTLLYFRNSYYFIEHLIFLMHTHTAIFSIYILTMIGLQIIGSKYLSWLNPLLVLFPLGIFYIGMLRYYKQNMLKTLVKFIIILILYSIILLAALLVILIVSMLLF